MRYAIMAGANACGPWCHLARLFGVDDTHALRVGSAIEVLHTYSLVHDDLPCMDDDDLRRGRPTTHIAFDEMTAVLAGDALLTIAFEILADARTHPSAEVRCALIARLTEASGHSGMIGGQVIDMLADKSFGVEDVIDLQRRKTGQLFEFSCEAGPILGGASAQDRARLKAYAEDMGVVFQITDDLLDVTSTAEKTGKAVGKDADMGKQTLVTLLGVEGARAESEAARRAVGLAFLLLTPQNPSGAVVQSGPNLLFGRKKARIFAHLFGSRSAFVCYTRAQGDFHESHFPDCKTPCETLGDGADAGGRAHFLGGREFAGSGSSGGSRSGAGAGFL
jgi:farnesyl diphosphate synthase